MKQQAQQALKAVFAFVLSALTSLGTVLVGDVGLGDVTDGQWLAVIVSGLVTGGAVYGIRNTPSA